MSAFDDLLDLGDSSQTNQGSDPFDPFGSGQTTNQTEGNSSGDLLDLGFDTQISTENGISGKVNFEANTNPLYEFTNSDNKMENDSVNPLFELSNEPVQKDLKSEPSNLLYEYMQNEGNTNGHVEDGLTNGGEQDVDLLGGGDLGGEDTQNVTEESGDLLGNSEPVISDDFGVKEDANNLSETQPGEVIQTRSRSSSESSEPEQDIEESAQKPSEPVSEPEGVPEVETPEQTSGPVDEGPKENEKEIRPVENNNIEESRDEVETKTTPEVLDEGTSETMADTEPEKEAEMEETAKDNQNDVPDHDNEADDNQEVVEPVSDSVVEKEPQIEPETNEQLNDNIDEVVEERNNVEEVPPVTDVQESLKEPEPVEPIEKEVSQEVEDVVPAEPEVSNEVEEVKPVDTVEPETNKDIEEAVTKEPEQDIPVTSIETPVEEEPASVDAVDVKEEPQDESQAGPEETTKIEEPDAEPDTVDLGVTTYKSTSFLILSPSSERSVVESFGRLREEEDAVAVEQKTATTDETRNSVPEENALKVNGTSDISENGISEEDAVHFAEMNSVREKFESGGKSDEDQAPRRVSVKDEYDQGGEFENEPVQNPDVVKETDRPKEELPEVGSAKSLVNRFKSIQEEKAQPVASSKRPSPPRDSEKVEYESQPTEHLPQYEGQTESGVFESEPKGHEDVVRSGDLAEDYKPEEGSAKNILNKFKEIQTESSQHKVHEKREITPDRSGKVEYVSEPRGEHIVYNETQTESGVFENVPKEEEDVVRSGEKADEILPEVGMAKSLLSKFKQMETEVGHRPPPSPNKEKPKKAEFVNSPRGYLEKYEPQVEAGEFENKPADRGEVVRSEDHTEDILPEVGSAKKTMERFREIQKQSSSPVSSKAKEITPPREQSPGRNVAGVFENTPAERDDLVRSGEVQPDELPEQGTTRNILNRFKEIQTSGSQSSSPGKKPKEFTPPPEAGVYENNPQEHLIIETRQAESGILESTPSKSQADVAREREATPESELPEQGFAKNLVSRWKQLESTSSSAKSTSSTSPRFKEFTPPRDSRGPLSPKSPAGVTNGVHPSDLPGQYQPQESTVIHENKPEVKEDVYREADTDWTDGMPAPNTTSSMLQRFKSIQEEAKINEKTPEPIHRKDDSQPPQPDTEEKGMFKVVQTEKCAACQKTVYAMEKLEMNGHIYHKNCFKCSHCSARLTAKTFSMNEGVIYCVNHFKQLFARKGNYDEGFGRQQYKKKWQGDKPEGATA
ncbi:protein P200-like isoform X3 [Mercenaria mercenaria]|uniref:protein P200-like isoform X3 n=1 Tax=Mercenaria mercenaria TaxID=6596 RepID=UPI00234F9EDD|nr:protein P200-like isoform X3 [Mercenaria mercenaria]